MTAMPAKRLIHTPLYDAWCEDLRISLDAPGRKTALANHMAETRGQPPAAWRSKVSSILARRLVINSEDLLTISAWRTENPA